MMSRVEAEQRVRYATVLSLARYAIRDLAGFKAIRKLELSALKKLHDYTILLCTALASNKRIGGDPAMPATIQGYYLDLALHRSFVASQHAQLAFTETKVIQRFHDLTELATEAEHLRNQLQDPSLAPFPAMPNAGAIFKVTECPVLDGISSSEEEEAVA